MSHSDAEIREQLDKILEDCFFPEDVARNDSNDGYIKYATKAILALIKEQTRLARIDELGMVQTLHGRYLTTTWVNERPMMIEERIAQLSNTKEDI